MSRKKQQPVVENGDTVAASVSPPFICLPVMEPHMTVGYGSYLAVNTVIAIWRSIGAIKQEKPVKVALRLWSYSIDFITQFPDASAEALEIELKELLDELLDDGNSELFPRSAAMSLMRHMILFFMDMQCRRAKLEAERPLVAVPVADPEDINYLPSDEDDDFTDMARKINL